VQGERATASGVGFAAPLLYAVASNPPAYKASFNDITAGNNDVYGLDNGLVFPATTGYDLASGLGSPQLTSKGGKAGLSFYLCSIAGQASRPTVTGLSPALLPVTGGTVTIGFNQAVGPFQFADTSSPFSLGTQFTYTVNSDSSISSQTVQQNPALVDVEVCRSPPAAESAGRRVLPLPAGQPRGYLNKAGIRARRWRHQGHHHRPEPRLCHRRVLRKGSRQENQQRNRAAGLRLDHPRTRHRATRQGGHQGEGNRHHSRKRLHRNGPEQVRGDLHLQTVSHLAGLVPGASSVTHSR
jgi:hypothetical protein